MTHTLTLREKTPLTPDVHRFVFDRPADYDFTPGQATDLALLKDGWEDETRPFTFTSLPADDRLEFTIKSYPDHDGVTEQLGLIEPGAEVRIDGPWGAIEDKGPGVFIAGGAGVTPFIAILRARQQSGSLDGCTLIFSNKTEADIILKDEWEAMTGLKCLFLLSEEDSDRYRTGIVDKDLLQETVADFDQVFYVCGPPKMVEDVGGALEELGVAKDRIVAEDYD